MNRWIEGNSSVEKWKSGLESKGLRAGRQKWFNPLLNFTGQLSPSESKRVIPRVIIKMLYWGGLVGDEYMFKKNELLACKLQVHM